MSGRTQKQATPATKSAPVTDKQAPSFSCTLVTQTSLDRMWTLGGIVERWKGPIALAVMFAFNTSRDTIALATAHLPRRVTVINVLHKGGEYPINILRNMAIKLVNTTHYMVIEVDLVPSVNLEQTILHQAMGKWLANPRMALVVPVFEHTSASPCLSSESECRSLIPETFPQLSACVQQYRCQAHLEVASNGSHGTTDNGRWLRTDFTERTYPIRCFDSLRYEPSVVLPRLPDTPRYNERFVGYGNNKIEQITHLRFVGFQFRVLAQGFLFHQAHQQSASSVAWLTKDSDLNKRMTQLFQDFKLSLEKKYLSPSTPLCANNVRAPKEGGDEPILT